MIAKRALSLLSALCFVGVLALNIELADSLSFTSHLLDRALFISAEVISAVFIVLVFVCTAISIIQYRVNTVLICLLFLAGVCFIDRLILAVGAIL